MTETLLDNQESLDNQEPGETSSTKGLTTLGEVNARIGTRFRFMHRFARKDSNACKRFLDAAALSLGLVGTDDRFWFGTDVLMDEGGDIPDEVSQGQINYLTINTLVKLYSVTINDPDFWVMAKDPGQAQIVRTALRDVWEARDWSEVARAAELKKDISGLGFVGFRWDKEYGPCFEHVDSWDLAVDPHVQATKWGDLRWAARRIRMPADEAERRYPKHTFSDLPDGDPNSDGYQSQAVEIWVYWDKTTECHVHNDEELERGRNLYGRVPLLVLQGDLNPKSPFRLGDFDLASGIQSGMSDLVDIMLNNAKHAGPQTFFNGSLFGEESDIETFQSGNQQEPIEVVGDPKDAVYRLPAEPLNEAVLKVFEILRLGNDATTGVNDYMRGVLEQNPKFATQVAAMTQQSGARGIATHVKYEKFITLMARTCLSLLRQFAEVHTDEEHVLMEAIGGVEQVKVVEASTTYKDPGVEQQSSMQLLDLAAKTQEVLAASTGKAWNLLKLCEDVLRAFQRRDTQDYFVDAPPQPQGPQEQVKISLSGKLTQAEADAAYLAAGGDPQAAQAGQAEAQQEQQQQAMDGQQRLALAEQMHRQRMAHQEAAHRMQAAQGHQQLGFAMQQNEQKLSFALAAQKQREREAKARAQQIKQRAPVAAKNGR